MAVSASQALFVGLGAVPGAWLRLQLVNRWEPAVPKKHWGTFAVNINACFALGLIHALNQGCVEGSGTQGLILLLGTGFFGSLSTFSTFMVEVLQELRAGRPLNAGVLAVVSVVIGLLAVALGTWLGTLG